MAMLSEAIVSTQAASVPLAQLQEKITVLGDQLTTSCNTVNTMQTKASYAAIAATPVRQMQAIHSIVISSGEDKDSSEDVITKIRNAVDAKTSGIRVDRIRKARDQKVIVGCEDKLELQRIKEKLESSQMQLKVEERQNKDPLVILRDVLASNTEADILKSIKTQNAHIIGHIAEEDYRVQVRYRKKARNPLEEHIVLQVSPPIWQRMTEVGKLHIDLQRITVKDQSPLIQCSKCLGYGHGKKLCTETEDLCSHCAGPHMRSKCPARLAGDPPECKNCKSAKHDRCDHNSFDESCPIRKKWDTIARSSVAYC